MHLIITDILLVHNFLFTVEYKGHCLLDACRIADPSRVKKYLTPDTVNFKHPYNGNCPLVSIKFIYLYSCEKCVTFKLLKNNREIFVMYVLTLITSFTQHVVAASPYPKRKQVLELLIRKGAQLNEQNKEFLTALHISCDMSHYDLMDSSLKMGAKVNALDAFGQTGT